MDKDIQQKIFEAIENCTEKGLRVGQLFDNIRGMMQKDNIDMYFADAYTILEYINMFANPDEIEILKSRVTNIEEHLVAFEIKLCEAKNASCAHCQCNEK